jgi:hypothetical protein
MKRFPPRLPIRGLGGRRGVGRWEQRLTSLTEWTFVVDLLPRGCTTTSDEYRALHRAARSLARDGLIQMLCLPRGRMRSVVGLPGLDFNLDFWASAGYTPLRSRSAGS